MLKFGDRKKLPYSSCKSCKFNISPFDNKQILVAVVARIDKECTWDISCTKGVGCGGCKRFQFNI